MSNTEGAVNLGYYSLASSTWVSDAVFVFVKGLNWKMILRKYFSPVKIEIVDSGISEEDFLNIVEKKQLTPEQLTFFTLGGNAPDFIQEKYADKKVVNIIENDYFSKFMGSHASLHFQDSALVEAAQESEDFGVSVLELKQVFQDVVEKIAVKSFADKNYILISIAEDADFSSTLEIVSRDYDLIDENNFFVVATSQDINRSKFNNNVIFVDLDTAFSCIKYSKAYYDFSNNMLAQAFAAAIDKPVYYNRQQILSAEDTLFSFICHHFLLSSSYLTAEGHLTSAANWFSKWAERYSEIEALNSLRSCYIFGFHPWEESKPDWWDDYKVITVTSITEDVFKSKWSLNILAAKRPKIIVWGKQPPEFLSRFVKENQIEFENILPETEVFNFKSVNKVYVYGQHPLAKHLPYIIADKEIIFLDKPSKTAFSQRWLASILSELSSACMLCLEPVIPQFLLEVQKEYGIHFIHFGKGLPLQLVPEALNSKADEQPFSYFLDLRAGFDAFEANDLEFLLQSYDFSKQKQLVESSVLLIRERITAFDRAIPVGLGNELLKIASPDKILIALQQGFNSTSFSNADLIRIAQLENPDATIVYLPVDANDAEQIAKHYPLVELLPVGSPISLTLQHVKRLYTVNAMLGFDALIRGIPVTTFGSPFYAGWGLTDDRLPITGRTKALSIEELFTGFCLLYLRYFNPVYKKNVSYQEALTTLAQLEIIRQKEAQIFELREKERAYELQKAEQQSVVLKKTTKKVVEESEFPIWYNPYVGAAMQKSLDSDKPVFLYIPWIAEHGNTLIARIRSSEYELVPLDFIENLNLTRRDVFRFARSNPDQYRRMIARRLVPLRNRISGIILTFDWAPVMRIIFGVCEELNIPRILIPHESVFVDRTKYYWDPFANASRPVADVILGWGGLQRDIFLERGYPQERFLAVGAPKFDPYVNYQSQLSRSQFCRLFGLRADRKIILFASQPLDSQLDHKVARESQRQAVSDLLDYCEEHGHQLLMRLPPSKDDILGKPLRDRLTQSEHGAVDDAVCYLVGAEEALFHCDLVTSVNSTMLFEGVLVGRPALSMKYIEFEQIWEGVGIPASHNREETYSLVSSIFSEGWQPSTAQMNWAAEMFSNGAFDGLASQRIRQYLEQVATKTSGLELRPSAATRLFAADPADSTVDLIGLDFNHPELKKIRNFAPKLFNAANVIDASLGAADISKVASIDIYLQWAGQQDLRQREIQQALGKERLIVEDGLLVNDRNNTPFRQKLSVSFDDGSSWLEDTGLSSRLVNTLQSDATLKRNESARVTKLINRIIDNRLSKHNHYPDVAIKIGGAERPKILLIDNISAKADAEKIAHIQQAFKDMLRDVIAEYPDHDILVKTELPKTKYVALNVLTHLPQVYFIDFNIHTRSLLDIAEKVFVVNASEGFEALLLGKEVHCYGKPFYAGWGLTTDHVAIPERTAKRTVKEIFHFAYVVSSRYYLPTEDRVCELEELVDYIVGTGS